MCARASEPAKEKRPVQPGEGKVQSSGCCAFLAVLRPSPRGEGVSSYLVCPAIHPPFSPCTPARIYDSGRASLWEGDLHWVDGEWMRGASWGLEALLCGKFVPARRRRKRVPDDDPGLRLSVESYTHEPPPRTATWVFLSLPGKTSSPGSSKDRTRTDISTFTCGRRRRTSWLSHGNLKVPPRCHHGLASVILDGYITWDLV